MPVGILDTLRGEKWRVRGLQHYRQAKTADPGPKTEDFELGEEESHELLHDHRQSQDDDCEDEHDEVEIDHEFGVEKRKGQLFWAAIRPPTTNLGGFRGRAASWVLASLLLGFVTLILIVIAVLNHKGRLGHTLTSTPKSTVSPLLPGIPSTILASGGKPLPTATSDTKNPFEKPDQVDDNSLSAPDYRKRYAWHSLPVHEQQAYIAALQCLRSLPPSLPRMPQNASTYSDFPYTHAHMGYRTHNSASFLPWHRYFLHTYEQTLRTKCDYQGRIPYWDWTRDADSNTAADLSTSMIFDPERGFGGNGANEGEVTAGQRGRCVIDGPFANLQVLWYDVKYQPHCLSRGFRTDAVSVDGKGEIDGSALRSSEIDKILALDTYEAFVSALEKQVHDVIPFGIGGDFETFSAPFEPLFWLHHSQLDRLWAIWQGRKAGRDKEYSGHRFRHSTEIAGLGDNLEYGALPKNLDMNEGDVTVQQIMDTEGGCSRGGLYDFRKDGVLCYSYD